MPIPCPSPVQESHPATFCAHVNHRDNENRIAKQLLASGADVAMGGGPSRFIGTNMTDPMGGASSRNDD